MEATSATSTVSNSHQSTYWKWQEAEIESLVTTSTFTSTSEEVTKQAHKPAKSGNEKQVKWSLDTAQPPAVATTQSVSGCDVPILNLCEALYGQTSDSDQAKTSIGFLSHEQHRHEVYLLERQLGHSSDTDKISLLSLLSERTSSHLPRRAPGIALSRRNRLQVAATLASSVLQLDGTNWVRDQWRAKDVFLMSRRESKRGPLDLYVTSRILNRNQESIPSERFAKNKAQGQALISLGLTLLELSFEQPLAHLRAPEDEDPIEIKQDWNTGERLLKYVADENGEEYRNVVPRCLYLQFDVDEDDVTFENAMFQREVYEKVVYPLNKLLEAFDGNLDALSYQQSYS